MATGLSNPPLGPSDPLDPHPSTPPPPRSLQPPRLHHPLDPYYPLTPLTPPPPPPLEPPDRVLLTDKNSLSGLGVRKKNFSDFMAELKVFFENISPDLYRVSILLAIRKVVLLV